MIGAIAICRTEARLFTDRQVALLQTFADQPADIPVGQPVRFESILNMRTAKALGIANPPIVLKRADEVIE